MARKKTKPVSMESLIAGWSKETELSEDYVKDIVVTHHLYTTEGAALKLTKIDLDLTDSSLKLLRHVAKTLNVSVDSVLATVLSKAAK